EPQERVERQPGAGRHDVWLSRVADGLFEHEQATAHRDDHEKNRDDEREPAMSDQEGAMQLRGAGRGTRGPFTPLPPGYSSMADDWIDGDAQLSISLTILP